MSSEDEAVAWLRAQIEGDKRRTAPVMLALAAFAEAPGRIPSVQMAADADEARERVADCEAKLELIGEMTALKLVGIAYPDEAGPESAAVMLGMLASAYRHREGYAEHWPAAGAATAP